MNPAPPVTRKRFVIEVPCTNAAVRRFSLLEGSFGGG